MPDKRKHRGPHPNDEKLFSPEALPTLREGVSDLSWLLTRGYADKSALKIVGDRFNLTERQRIAVMRCACSDAALEQRSSSQVHVEDTAGHALVVDGYNLLTTVEAALAGGVILAARDGCYRDVASMHGTFRKVEETEPALSCVARVLADLDIPTCTWLLDSPVSNSGRLREAMLSLAEQGGWNWRIELVPNPDHLLSESSAIVATADSVILDRCERWINLARQVVNRMVPDAWIIELDPAS